MPGLTRRSALVVAFLCAMPACMSPTNAEEEVAQAYRAQLDALAASVAGPWRGGTSVGFALAFDLQQAGTAVSGGGTITENGVTHEARYTVSGTYQRPKLTLTFTGGLSGAGRRGRLPGRLQLGWGTLGAAPPKAAEYSKDIEIGLYEPQ